MRKVNDHQQPQHGLQMEETLAAGDAAGVQHLFRYWLAWQYISAQLRGVTVWDMGCGCAYGCRILSQPAGDRAAKVIGIDRDRRALNAGRAIYAGLDLLEFNLDTYWAADVFLPGSQPDVVCCFDVLERLKHREVFLEQLTRRLSRNSVVYISTNHLACKTCPPTTGPFTYDTDTIIRLLSRYFSKVVPAAVDSYTQQVNSYIATYRRADVPAFTVGDDVFVCSGSKQFN